MCWWSPITAMQAHLESQFLFWLPTFAFSVCFNDKPPKVREPSTFYFFLTIIRPVLAIEWRSFPTKNLNVHANGIFVGTELDGVDCASFLVLECEKQDMKTIKTPSLKEAFYTLWRQKYKNIKNETFYNILYFIL